MTKKERVILFFKDYSIILIGSAIYALSVKVFTAPNDIAPGGLTGIATILNSLFSLPIGVMVIVMNIPLFIWGAIENGTRFLLKTAIATVLSSILIDIFELIPYVYEGEKILAALFGGVLSGIGLAMIFYRGGSTGGTDIIGKCIHKHCPHISMGSIILVSDMAVVAMAAIVYRSIENAMYAIIAIFVSTKIIDSFVYGFSRDNGKLMIIITAIPDEISKVILERSQRGVTVVDGQGAYSRQKRGVLLCAARPSEVFKIKSMITSADPSAFIIITTATTISGEGFLNAEDIMEKNKELKAKLKELEEQDKLKEEASESKGT